MSGGTCSGCGGRDRSAGQQEDPDGERGWIVARLLNPKRGAIVIGDGLAEMRAGHFVNTGFRLRFDSHAALSGSARIALGSGRAALDIVNLVHDRVVRAARALRS